MHVLCACAPTYLHANIHKGGTIKNGVAKRTGEASSIGTLDISLVEVRQADADLLPREEGLGVRTSPIWHQEHIFRAGNSFQRT